MNNKYMKLPEVLLAPELPESIATHAKWLAGEGAGSWFVVQPKSEYLFEVTRFDPYGEPECIGEFSSEIPILIEGDWSISYPSHCALVTLIIQNHKYTLNRMV